MKSKKPSKKGKKRKTIPKEEMRFFMKLNRIKSVYLDNALLGYQTDDNTRKHWGAEFLKWCQKEKKETIISYVNIYELRPLFRGKIEKIKPSLSKKVLQTLNDFNPNLLTEGQTQKIARKYRKLWFFLKDELKVSEADAAHFVIAVGSKVHLFVSFNKRAFQNKKIKISNELIKYNLKIPQIWTLKEIRENIARFNNILKYFNQSEK